jgi:hypothetical protein
MCLIANRRIINITFMMKSTTRPHPINIPIILVGHDQHPGVIAQQEYDILLLLTCRDLVRMRVCW